MAGGKGAKVQVTEYYMSMHQGICSTMDALLKIIVKEKVAWSGYLSGQTVININQPDLFGGVKKEGGVKGNMYFLPGDADQVLPDVLAQRLGRANGADAPGYRGLASAFFIGDKHRGFYWTANNPYLPGIWATGRRAPVGLNPSYALIPRPGSNFFPFTSVAGLAGFNVEALTPSGRTAIVLSSTGIQLWDMASRTLTSEIVADNPAGYDIGVDSETSFYGVIGGPALRHYDVDGSYTVVTTDFDTPVIGGVQYVAGRVIVLPGSDADLTFNFFNGSSVANVSVGFNATGFFEGSDGDAWLVGPVRSGGDVGIGHLMPDGSVDVFFVHTGSDADCGGIDNGNGQFFIAQQNAGGFLIDKLTQAIVHTSTSTNVGPGGNELREDFNIARNSSSNLIWIGFAQWSAATGELVRSVVPANWKSASAQRTVYDRLNNSLLSYEAFTSTSATWRDLDRGDLDANPAHIIYEALTNTDWGMGSPTSLIDVDSFEDAGVVLYNEPLGLSMIWTRQSSIQDFIQEVLDHIQAALFVDPQTGLLTLKLIRGDYDIGTLSTIDPSNATLSNFGRKLWGEIVNEISVTWTNPENEQDETVTVHDLASITTQGGVITDSRNYYGVRYALLAQRLAARDLRSAGAPLAACDAEVDRSLWFLRPASVVLLDWPEYGLVGLVMRVTSIDYGKPGDPTLKLSLIEDVFGLDAGDYVDPPSTSWEDTSAAPTPMSEQEALTLPYFMAKNAVTSIEGATYPEVLAGVLGASSNADAYGFELWGLVTLTDGSTEWQSLASLNIVGRGELAANLAAEAATTSATFASYVGAKRPQTTGFAIIGAGGETGNEIALITATGSSYSLARGVLDTVPKAWTAGTPVWFIDGEALFEDPDARSVAEVVEYRLLTRTSQGMLSLAAASVLEATMSERPWLPSRPANVTIDSVKFNTAATAVDMIGETVVPVTWANRNRLLEDAIVLTWTDATVTPETGQTTTITVLKADETTVLATHTGLIGTSYNVPVSDFGSEVVGLIKVSASRTDADGTFDSLQGHGIWIRVAAAGGAEGASGSGVASFAGAAAGASSLSASGTGTLSPSSSATAGSSLSGSGTGAGSFAGSSGSTPGYRFYGVRAKTTGVGYVSCNQFSLFEGGGSTDRSLAGTAGTDFSINNGFVASNVNDSNTSTFCASANSSAAGTNGVLWIDFGSGNKFDIRKFGWRARTDASGENPLTWEVVAKQASGDAWTVLCQLPNKASWTLGEYFEQTFLSLSYASQAVSSTASNSVTPTYDGPAATFAVTSGSLPSGMSLNSSTGELTGTAGSTQSGIVITATLSDGSGVAVVSSSFTLTAAVGYRYYFLEFITTPNGFIGASTIKLLDAGSTDHALSSGGAVATTVSYTQNGSFPVTNCNDGNDTSFTTSSAGTAAASGHGILIDMGSIYDITKLGYRSRSDSFGTVEAMKTGNVKAKVYAGASYTTLHAIDETATPYGNNEYREYTL
jgi:hypothetical protein